jgi:hypothetical protein
VNPDPKPCRVVVIVHTVEHCKTLRNIIPVLQIRDVFIPDPDQNFSIPVPDPQHCIILGVETVILRDANPDRSSESTSTFSHLTVFCVYLPALVLYNLREHKNLPPSVQLFFNRLPFLVPKSTLFEERYRIYRSCSTQFIHRVYFIY